MVQEGKSLLQSNVSSISDSTSAAGYLQGDSSPEHEKSNKQNTNTGAASLVLDVGTGTYLPSELSTEEIIRYRKMLAYCFNLAKGEHIQGGFALKDVCINVERESSGGLSFCLQKHFDDLYEGRKKSSNGAARFRQILFADTLPRGLLCQWKVTYKTQVKYGSAKGMFNAQDILHVTDTQLQV